MPVFIVALVLFLGGYLLQFAGHALEGTDPGEIIYFKRKLGLPYVEFPPDEAHHGIPRRQPELSLLVGLGIGGNLPGMQAPLPVPLLLAAADRGETGLVNRPRAGPPAKLT